MGLEIERKFLIKDDSWKEEADSGTSIRQGYLNSASARTVRVRVRGANGFLTVKGKSEHLTRQEFEYPVPLEDALSMLELCEKPIIEKTRFLLPQGYNTWEIDVFEGQNKGLVVAEIELSSEEDTFESPSWLGVEVSTEAKYFNSSLIINPYINWNKQH